MIRLFPIVVAFGCATYETVRDADGEVYECSVRGETVELCYFADSSEELSDMLHARSCQLTDRWWPLITNAIGKGCRYSCTATTPGCNAKQGCYCPQ